MKKFSKGKRSVQTAILFLGLLLTITTGFSAFSAAATSKTGTIGIEGIIHSPPPSRGATIAVPANGAVFTSNPITVSGICPDGLLIKIFDNNVFVGSVVCSGGSYTLQIDLFNGQNNLVARDYDSLGQSGPDSSTVSVVLDNGFSASLGVPLTLASNYAELGADPGSELAWPIILSGGNGPYAVSVDWGDGSSNSLTSLANPGSFTIKHTYSQSGVYKILITATDKNGETAFLQVVGQANGAIQANTNSSNNSVIVKTNVVWWPSLLMVPLILLSFWLGERQGKNKLLTDLQKRY